MVGKILFLVLLGTALVLANPVSKEDDHGSAIKDQPIAEEKVGKLMEIFNAAKKTMTYISDRFDGLKDKGGKLYDKLSEFFDQSKECWNKLREILSQSGKEGKVLYELITKSDNGKDAKKKETPKN